MPRKRVRRSTANSGAKSRLSSPKTTRPLASSRRGPPKAAPSRRGGRLLDAFPDRIDIRDWFYQPVLAPLPDQIVNCDQVPLILDQLNEGACTGFALAAVINYHLAARHTRRRVSPRMLYEMARRYDEWPGERYEGSSARGAMKGWVGHGVCSEDLWPIERRGLAHFRPKVALDAEETPGGAYYRVKHREIRDMHAALAESGILYVTLMVHAGWDDPGKIRVKLNYVESGNYRELEIPVIVREGRADGGHAVAIVGYTRDGFIVQNSWGPSWGAQGFALLPYEDYLIHAADVWVAQVGVPVKMDSWTQQVERRTEDTSAGLHRASHAIPLADIRPYVVDIGNNGELSESGAYWTTEEDVERLFSEIIPDRTKAWERRRILLYLHGGLNDEREVAQRIVAFRDVCLRNEIYPLHIMWESGLSQSLRGMVRDLFTDVDERAGRVRDWLEKVREGLIEAKDRSLELTAAAPGGALWKEMKENARLASTHPGGLGGMQIIAKQALKALRAADPAERERSEVHIVGHSAGSIFLAHAIRHLVKLGPWLKTMQFMAPAITVEDFANLLLDPIRKGQCPIPTSYILSDEGELDDDVGPYGKSLLYLVSNAFESKRGMPLLGMERFLLGPNVANPDVGKLFAGRADGRPNLVIAGRDQGAGSQCESESHGGFDNDPKTMNSILFRILGNTPDPLFTVRDLQFT